jgi:glycosyltransferase involved in cell wall biosynthesis
VRATFLLSKDPGCQSTGDLTMAKLLMDLAREAYDVRAICLSPEPGCTVGGHRRVAKRPIRPVRLLIESVRRGHSLIHTRFVSDELIQAVEGAETDIFVADHSYMAEAVLRSRRFAAHKNGSSILAVSTSVREALVWRATQGRLLQAECPRIVRDEIRVANSAYTVGCYDKAETQFYAERGHPRAHWLDVTLPPAARIPVADSGPRLVFLGDRHWAPNQKAYEEILRLWPRISHGIPRAKLYIVGAPDPKAKALPLPDGVHDLGFVDDLDKFVASCRAMVAPITTGGGVRAKILDAVSRGLPVVGTSAAIGSLDDVLGIEAYDDESGLIDQCRRYLVDAAAAADDGDALYQKNAAYWRAGKPHRSVQDWLKR